MKKLSIIIILALACVNSFAQEYDYDEPVYDDESYLNDYPEEESQYYGESYEEPRATYCGINKHGNEFCNYDNGCYHYWNKNGTQYHHCPGDEREDAFVASLEEMLDRVKREESCGVNYPGTIIDKVSGNCVCPDQKNGGPRWDPVSKSCPYVPATTAYDNQEYVPVTTGDSEPPYWIFTFIALGIAIFAIIKSEHNSKRAEDKISEVEKAKKKAHHNKVKKYYEEHLIVSDKHKNKFDDYIVDPRSKEYAEIRSSIEKKNAFLDEHFEIGDGVYYLEPAKDPLGYISHTIIKKGKVIAVLEGGYLEIEFPNGTQIRKNKFSSSVHKIYPVISQ